MTTTQTDRLAYVSSLAIKAPCVAATTANITLSGLQTIDGVALADGDRVLVKNQTTGSENGIYLARVSAWQRASDFDGAYDAAEGTLVIVNGGSTNGGLAFTVGGSYTIGTDSIVFNLAFGQLLSNGSVYAATVGGTADVITLSTGLSLSSYATGQIITFKPTANNTTNVTVNVDGIGAKSVVKRGSSDLTLNDLVSGMLCIIEYDGTNFQLLSRGVVKSGDIDNSSVLTAAISDANVTYAKIQNISATDKILGRSDDGAGVTQEITCTAAGRALIDDADASAQRATLGFTNAVVQIVDSGSTAQSTGTTIIPGDATIPQNTEGDQYLTATITPKSASNRLLIEVLAHTGHSVADCAVTAALFQGSTAGAICAGVHYCNAAKVLPAIIRHEMAAGTTSATTFNVRIGGSVAGTTYFNRNVTGNLLGGVLRSSIRITEIAS